MSVSLYGSGQTVLQVVTGTANTQTSTSGSTYVNTGLSATITPQSTNSKILVIASQQMYVNSNGLVIACQIARNSSGVSPGYEYCLWANSSQTMSNISLQYLDSPATTSATTYTTQMKVRASSGTVSAQYGDGNGQASSYIILLEISGS